MLNKKSSMIEQSPILVTGCPRSGTSLVGTAIHMCGAFQGKLIKRGMFENNKILEEVVIPYFKNIGADPLGQHPLPNVDSISIPVDWRKRIEQIIKDEGYSKGQWVYKDSRLSLIWPVWNYAFPNAKWIIVRRRTGDIVQSCLKTVYMAAFDEREDWIQWVRQYEKRFVGMIEAGVNCKVVWPERMVCGDYQQMHETLDWVGLTWNKEVINWIDPLLWVSRQKEREM